MTDAESNENARLLRDFEIAMVEKNLEIGHLHDELVIARAELVTARRVLEAARVLETETQWGYERTRWHVDLADALHAYDALTPSAQPPTTYQEGEE